MKMKKIAVGILLAAISTPAFADVSYNVGLTSEYFYRGIFQKDFSISAGIDYEKDGFYVGSWVADVGEGLEVDGYFGYGVETDSGVSASIGVTGYYYTGSFDETYEEVNLGLGYKMLNVEYSVGKWEDDDYDFLALTIEGDSGVYAKYGTFGKDFDGDYYEFGYGTTLYSIDLSGSAIFNDDSNTLVFSVGKTF
mgnify:CR=1 FL=1